MAKADPYSTTSPVKITSARCANKAFVHGILIYARITTASHSVAISADQWPDDLRLSDLEPRLVCSACGTKGSDIRPNFNMNPVRMAQNAMAAAYFFKRNEKALELARGVIAHVPTYPVSLRFAAASLAHLGKLDEARATIERLRLAYPNAAISNMRVHYRYPWMLELLKDAMRRAALPE